MGRQCEQDAESERQGCGNAVSFLSVLLILQTESWVTTHTHTHWGKLCRNSHCRYQVLQTPPSPAVLSLFLLCIYVCSSLAHGIPASFSLFFGLRWKTPKPHPALPPFLSLSSVWENSPLCWLLYCDYYNLHAHHMK